MIPLLSSSFVSFGHSPQHRLGLCRPGFSAVLCLCSCSIRFKCGGRGGRGGKCSSRRCLICVFFLREDSTASKQPAEAPSRSSPLSPRSSRPPRLNRFPGLPSRHPPRLALTADGADGRSGRRMPVTGFGCGSAALGHPWLFRQVTHDFLKEMRGRVVYPVVDTMTMAEDDDG